MASTPQHRCVFVGNIPYDASEEQLIQICEEVGPVVSFRLVIDRETGKPKGYGFCEYKDEETALSARRNLQGYEINGRQLRVDFAENDKGADRNREQGRGGPGMAVSVEQKQIGGITPGDLAVLQPIGLPLAMTAASVMAGALGGSQVGSQLNHNDLQNQPVVGNDPLTLHLSKMSRNQLTQILSEMKALATQNKELSRQLLLAHPQLLKAIFQAQIILGMVTPQMLQMPNIQKNPGDMPHPSWQIGQPGQQLEAPNPLGLPPLTHLSSVPHSSFANNPFSAPMQIPGQPTSQLPSLTHLGTPQQTKIPGQSGAATVSSAYPKTLSGMSAGRQTPMQASSVSAQRPVLLQGQGQQGHSGQYSLPAVSVAQQSHVSRPMLPDPGYQIGSLVDPGINGRTAGANVLRGLSDRSRATQHMNHLSKLVKLEEGRSAPSSTTESNASASTGSRPESQNLAEKALQVQLPPEMVRQVMNLTPEQLTSLPPEQRQQVLQLQQMLR